MPTLRSRVPPRFPFDQRGERSADLQVLSALREAFGHHAENGARIVACCISTRPG